MLVATGVKWVRMGSRMFCAVFSSLCADMTWAEIERTRGVYDFSKYDGLFTLLRKYDMKAVFILDYGNPLYDQGLAPFTDDGRNAFARFAAAACAHFPPVR